jgi:hypothetical protein
VLHIPPTLSVPSRLVEAIVARQQCCVLLFDNSYTLKRQPGNRRFESKHDVADPVPRVYANSIFILLSRQMCKVSVAMVVVGFRLENEHFVATGTAVHCAKDANERLMCSG